MSSKKEKCPIWGWAANRTHFVGDGILIYEVDCKRAGGRYAVNHACIAELQACNDNRFNVRITSWLHEQRRAGIDLPIITESVIDFVKYAPNTQIHDRADKLLRYFEKKTSYLGEFVKNPAAIPFEERIEVLIITESIDKREVEYLLKFLQKEKWVEISQNLSDVGGYVLTAEGYGRISEISKRNIDSSQVFVAMWFDDSMKEAWEQGIKLGIQDAGYRPVRIDQKEHTNKIDDEIIAEIRRSRFIIADFTHGESGARGGVYYEAGFAHGLNIPVIFTCREDIIEHVHFDTRQYSHIVWKTPEDLRQRLSHRISAVVGDGPHKNRDARIVSASRKYL